MELICPLCGDVVKEYLDEFKCRSTICNFEYDKIYGIPHNVLYHVTLNYPEAREWMWDYCVYLGHFSHNDKNYDLGVYVHVDGELSLAIVYGNEYGKYISREESCYFNTTNPVYLETLK